MNFFLKIKKLLLIVLFAVIGTSCDSKNEPVVIPIDNSITTIASKNGDLTILVQALVKTDLSLTLKGSGPYTLFAPTNKAFSAFLSENGFATIYDVPTEVLKQILLNHVVNGSLKSSALKTGYLKTLAIGSASDSNTLSMYLNTSSGVKLNGVSSVTTPNIVASNGIIHIVDAVIKLPTIIDHVRTNLDFSATLTALSSNTTIDFENILSGNTGPFTIFAPKNEAFGIFLSENGYSSLAEVSPTFIEKTLKYHIIVGSNALSPTFTENQILNTYSGQNVIVKLNPTRLMDVSDRDCNIGIVDIQCSNGIIHGLDKVLLPTF